MRKNIRYYFDLAAFVANKKESNRAFKLAAVGKRNDGVIVVASNSSTIVPFRKAHAEWRLSKKMDYNGTVFIVRLLRKDASLAIARPCLACQKILLSRRIAKVYYSISNTEYGIYYPITNTDSYHLI